MTAADDRPAGPPGEPEPPEVPAGDAVDVVDVELDSLAQALSGAAPESVEDRLDAALALADARLGDLHRERAEFVNFRRRVERDQAVATADGIARLLEAMLPVLDDITLAREHGDLDGTPFAAVAEKLEGTLTRFGLESYGAAGDAFDPAVHEALLHDPTPAEGAQGPVVVRVLQPGYRLRTRIVRPARVAVADPA